MAFGYASVDLKTDNSNDDKRFLFCLMAEINSNYSNFFENIPRCLDQEYWIWLLSKEFYATVRKFIQFTSFIFLFISRIGKMHPKLLNFVFLSNFKHTKIKLKWNDLA